MLKRRKFFHMKFLSSFLLLTLIFSLPTIAQQPNILLYIVDDVGVDPIPNYAAGSQKAHMPTLEALMDSGLTLDNAWSSPLCSPSRANILTGKYGFRTNVLSPTTFSQLDTAETTLHTYLDQVSNGMYSSSLIGKWHLSGQMNPDKNYPAKCGIPHYAGNLGGAVQDFWDWDLAVNGTVTPEVSYLTSTYTDLAINWINQQNQPWFCWLAHNSPHEPLHVPPAHMHAQGNLPADQDSIDANPFPYFQAMLESTDYELGRLLDSLPQAVRDNTVVIFIGDNGTPRNVLQRPYAGKQSKSSLYQGGIHVPMVIAGPGITRQGEREDALINFTDLFTTIVELAGYPLREYHDSKSFWPLLTQAGPSIRKCAYTEKITDNNSVAGWTTRDETYKLIRFSDGVDEFYDLIADPYEKNNLLSGTLTPQEQMAFDNLVICNPQDATSIDDLQAETSLFHLYPNPTRSALFISLSTRAPQPFQIITLTGKTVMKGQLAFGENRVAIEHLPNGIYAVQLGTEVKRFVVND